MTSGPAFRRFAFAYGAAFAIFYVVAPARMGAFSSSRRRGLDDVLAHVWRRWIRVPNGRIVKLGVQAVEAVSFVDRQPLAQLSAGQVVVEHCPLALADDGGAVNLAARKSTARRKAR